VSFDYLTKTKKLRGLSPQANYTDREGVLIKKILIKGYGREKGLGYTGLVHYRCAILLLLIVLCVQDGTLVSVM
jgi:hypothetical protein